MEIFYEKENKTENISLENPKTIKEILKEKNISIDSVIIVKNDNVCLEDETVCNTDKLKLLSVISGG